MLLVNFTNIYCSNVLPFADLLIGMNLLFEVLRKRIGPIPILSLQKLAKDSDDVVFVWEMICFSFQVSSCWICVFNDVIDNHFLVWLHAWRLWNATLAGASGLQTRPNHDWCLAHGQTVPLDTNAAPNATHVIIWDSDRHPAPPVTRGTELPTRPFGQQAIWAYPKLGYMNGHRACHSINYMVKSINSDKLHLFLSPKVNKFLSSKKLGDKSSEYKMGISHEWLTNN